MAKKRGTDDDTLREWTFDDDLPDEYVMKGHKPAKQRGNVVDIETREPVKTVVNKTAYTNAFALGCRDRLRPHHAYSWSHGWRHRNNGELWTDDPEGLTLLAELSEMIGTNKKLMPSQVRGILQAHLHRPDGWDSHHHEIALPDHRIYNLDTGEVRDAQADDQHTRRLDAVPVKGPHPNWDKVLNHICRDDTEKLWLQTWCGYCLTGHVDPRHWFVFLSGPGNGGKSTLLTAITRIAGSYHRGLPADAFTGDRHLEWLARLDGARFGTILELPATAWRKIEVLKGLVAGDPMTANFMRRNSFDFKPVIKIMIAGNTRPRLPGGDSGLRRRMVNIHVPEVTNPEPNLTTRLHQELPAITAWALQGARLYVTNGLPDIPDRWAEETRQYLDDEDEMGDWINTRIAITTNGFTPSTELREAYEKDTGHKLGSVTPITSALRNRGIVIASKPQRHKGETVRGVTGVELVNNDF